MEAWRERIRQAWILGLVDREMAIGKGHNLLGDMVYNTFTLTSSGQQFLENPYSIQLPVVASSSIAQQVCT